MIRIKLLRDLWGHKVGKIGRLCSNRGPKVWIKLRGSPRCYVTEKDLNSLYQIL